MRSNSKADNVSCFSRIKPKRGLQNLTLALMASLIANTTQAEPKATVQNTAVSTAPSAPPNHPPDFIAPVPNAVLPIWPGEPPCFVAGGRPEQVKNERFINVSYPQLLVYLPPKEKATGTALLICAGGGYGGLAMCIHVDNVVKLFNDRGIAVIGVKYWTAYGKNDVAADALADGKRAIKLVRSHAKEWNIAPDRIGLQGYSAGAHLCLNVIGHFDAGEPQSADPIERFSSRPDFCLLMSTWPYRKPLEAYPLAHNAPPTWIASATDDTIAPMSFSQGIYDKLKSMNVPVEMFAVEKGGHSAFHYGMSKSLGARWPEPLFNWLNKIGMLGTR